MDTYIIQKYQKLVWILIHLKPKGWSCLNVICVKQLFKTKNGYLFLTSLCTFPRKSLLAMVVVSLIILIHASQFPCDHSHHWDPSNHSYPSHLSIHDSNSIDPTTLILLTSLITMAMVFMFFLTKSLSLLPKCFGRVVVF